MHARSPHRERQTTLWSRGGAPYALQAKQSTLGTSLCSGRQAPSFWRTFLHECTGMCCLLALQGLVCELPFPD